MQLGFINFSQEELARKNKVLQMVRDQIAIDELGFGRDAFLELRSNKEVLQYSAWCKSVDSQVGNPIDRYAC